MRWDFILFFASLVMIYLGDWALYIGVGGLVVSVLHGTLRVIADQRIRRMIVAIGLVISGVTFIGLGAFALRPNWFGLSATPTPMPAPIPMSAPAPAPTAMPSVPKAQAANDYSPYDLTPEKLRTIAQEAIAPTSGTNAFQIIIVDGCTECLKFSDAFTDLIKTLPGWNLTSVGQAFGTRERIRGVWFEVADVNHQPESARVLQKAFQKAGIIFSVHSTNMFRVLSAPPSEFILYLGQYLGNSRHATVTMPPGFNDVTFVNAPPKQ